GAGDGAAPGEGGQGPAGQRVGERLVALANAERARVVVLVVRDQHRAAVRVAERHVHDLPVPPRGAERGAGDAHRPRRYEPGQVAERVVLGVLGHGVAGADGDDGGAGGAAAHVRAAGRVEGQVPVDDGLRPV